MGKHSQQPWREKWCSYDSSWHVLTQQRVLLEGCMGQLQITLQQPERAWLARMSAQGPTAATESLPIQFHHDQRHCQKRWAVCPPGHIPKKTGSPQSQLRRSTREMSSDIG